MTEPHNWPFDQPAGGTLRPWYFRATGYLMVLFSDPESPALVELAAVHACGHSATPNIGIPTSHVVVSPI